jgi:type II secretory pathway component PulK
MKPSNHLRRRQGSVIVVILALITMAAFLINRFVERTMTEMLIESRARISDRLRSDAHSALEATLAVLADYQAADNGLRSPAQGWGAPLAGLDLPSRPGVTVTVQFEDETGRPSLPRLQAADLVTLGRFLGLKENDAAIFAEGLLVWTKTEQTSARFETDPRNYEYEDPPHHPPGRPLASFAELAAVAGVRQYLYGEDGRPNALYERLAHTVSLYDFPAINLNTATMDTLALAGIDSNQAARLHEFTSGKAKPPPGAPPYFRSVGEAQTQAGITAALTGFDTLVRCLRIRVTVREGATAFHLVAVVSPGGGNDQPETAANSSAVIVTSAPAPTGKSLGYPFTLLSLEEKIELAAAPVS